MMQNTGHYKSPLGGITFACEGSALTGLWFDRQKYFGATLTADCAEKEIPAFSAVRRWLDIYFSGCAPQFTPRLLLQGTDFQKAVWNILLAIPYGRTLTYGEIAREMAVQRGLHRMSARAVGSAVAHNPVSLIVPCHRVIGAGGRLTGYAAGTDKKLLLLKLEGIVK